VVKSDFSVVCHPARLQCITYRAYVKTEWSNLRVLLLVIVIDKLFDYLIGLMRLLSLTTKR